MSRAAVEGSWCGTQRWLPEEVGGEERRLKGGKLVSGVEKGQVCGLAVTR